MTKRNRSDYLLIEILIAVFFLMLTLTVLVRVFSVSRNMAVRSQVETEALSEAQNIVERLYGCEDPAPVLEELGFVSSHGSWTRYHNDYQLMVAGDNVPLEGGRLWEGNVYAYVSDQREENQGRQEAIELFMLPCVWYRGV